ncbi:MAG: spore cortex biosynthesis protein YabQ [Sarcina sp.]
MVLEINLQIKIVLFSFLAGLLIGLLFDGYKLIRGFSPIKIILIIQDTLFWILISLIIFIFLMYFNFGFLSLYIYLLIGAGLMVYLMFFSKKIFKVENLIATHLYRFIRVISKNIQYILKNIFVK